MPFSHVGRFFQRLDILEVAYKESRAIWEECTQPSFLLTDQGHAYQLRHTRRPGSKNVTLFGGIQIYTQGNNCSIWGHILSMSDAKVLALDGDKAMFCVPDLVWMRTARWSRSAQSTSRSSAFIFTSVTAVYCLPWTDRLPAFRKRCNYQENPRISCIIKPG